MEDFEIKISNTSIKKIKNNILNEKNKSVIIILVIFFISLIFRVFFLNLIEFKADQAISFFQTYEFYQNPQVISTGLISSLGTYNFPLFNYLLIFLSFFFFDPQRLSFAIALINSFFIVGFYIFIKKFYDPKLAIIASLIMATSPWAILLSRSIWAQDLILVLVFPILFFLHQLVINKKNNVVFPLFALLFLFIQLHSSGIYFLITTVIILIVLKIKVNKKLALLGFIFGLFPAIPYFIFELTSNPFCRDCHVFFSYLNSPKIFDFYNFLRPFQLLTGLSFQYELGKNFQTMINFAPFLKYLNWFFILESLGLLIGAIIVIRFEKKYFFLILYFFLLPFLFFITRVPSYPHYYVSILPISSLIISFFILHLLKMNKPLGILIILVILISNVLFESVFYLYLEKNQNITGDYGPIYQLTDQKINNEIKNYKSTNYFEELKYYSYIFAQSNILHQNLGNYLMNKNNFAFAKEEFIKQLTITPKSTETLANLAYVYILDKDYSHAQKTIEKLRKLDKKSADQLEALINH